MCKHFLCNVAEAIVENEQRMRQDELDDLTEKIREATIYASSHPNDEDAQLTVVMLRDKLGARRIQCQHELNDFVHETREYLARNQQH